MPKSMLVTYSIEYIRLFDNTISVVYDAYCHRKPTIQKKKKGNVLIS